MEGSAAKLPEIIALKKKYKVSYLEPKPHDTRVFLGFLKNGVESELSPVSIHQSPAL